MIQKNLFSSIKVKGLLHVASVYTCIDLNVTPFQNLAFFAFLYNKSQGILINKRASGVDNTRLNVPTLLSPKEKNVD